MKEPKVLLFKSFVDSLLLFPLLPSQNTKNHHFSLASLLPNRSKISKIRTSFAGE